jgi:hypothetical protein
MERGLQCKEVNFLLDAKDIYSPEKRVEKR